MKSDTTPNMIEGPEAYDRFKRAVKKVLTIPKVGDPQSVRQWQKEKASRP